MLAVFRGGHHGQDVACGVNQVMRSFKVVGCNDRCVCDGTVIYGRKYRFGKPGGYGKDNLTSAFELIQAQKPAYKLKFVTEPVTCSNDAMGGDPDVGYYKYCLCNQDCLDTQGDWITQTDSIKAQKSKLTVKLEKLKSMGQGQGNSPPKIIVAPRGNEMTFDLSDRATSWIGSLHDVPPGLWQVTYKVHTRSGEKTCKGPVPLQEIRCLDGYENKDGNCTKKMASTCGDIKVDQLAGYGARNGNLQISVTGTSIVPELLLSPINASQSINASLVSKDSGTYSSKAHRLKSGVWQLGYRSGNGICNDSIALEELKCQDGHEIDQFGHCSHINETRSLCSLVDVPGVDQTGTKISADTTLNITLREGADTEAFQQYLRQQAEVRLVPDVATTKEMQQVTRVQLGKTGLYSVQIEVGSSVCPLRQSIEVICAANKEQDQSSGACMDKCPDKKVRTKEGACDSPAVKASIESDGLELKLKKFDPHLTMNEVASKTINVGPKGTYELQMSETLYTVTSQDSESGQDIKWVKLGAQTKNTFPIEFNTSGIEDGRLLNATLTFSATLASNASKYVPVTPGTVELFAVLDCVPSLEKSTMTINGQSGPNLVITQGQEVDIKIQARDHEDKLISDSKGRYMDVTWRVRGCDGEECLEKRSTSFKEGDEENRPWFLKLSSLDLSEPGVYEIWISKAFGYAVNISSTTDPVALKMPTKVHPYTITVKSSQTKKIIAGVLGVVAFGSLGGVLWYAKNNQGKLGV